MFLSIPEIKGHEDVTESKDPKEVQRDRFKKILREPKGWLVDEIMNCYMAVIERRQERALSAGKGGLSVGSLSI